MSDHVSVEILNQAVEMELRKIASDAILFEKMEAERWVDCCGCVVEPRVCNFKNYLSTP